jgi:hypothetical protein
VGGAAARGEGGDEVAQAEATDEAVDGAGESEQLGGYVRLEGKAVGVEVVPGRLAKVVAQQAEAPRREVGDDGQGGYNGHGRGPFRSW